MFRTAVAHSVVRRQGSGSVCCFSYSGCTFIAACWCGICKFCSSAVGCWEDRWDITLLSVAVTQDYLTSLYALYKPWRVRLACLYHCYFLRLYLVDCTQREKRGLWGWFWVRCTRKGKHTTLIHYQIGDRTKCPWVLENRLVARLQDKWNIPRLWC